MKKSSKVAISLSLIVVVYIAGLYMLSGRTPASYTHQDGINLVRRLQNDVANRDESDIISQISPDESTKIANMRVPELRQLLARAFFAMKNPHAEVSQLQVNLDGSDAVISGNLSITDAGNDFSSRISQGHIILYLQPTKVPQFFGLYSASKWRIIQVTWSGEDPSKYMDDAD